MSTNGNRKVHIETKGNSETKEIVLSQDPKTMEANMKLQDAFYGDGGGADENAPIYLAQNETPAIKINEKQ